MGRFKSRVDLELGAWVGGGLGTAGTVFQPQLFYGSGVNTEELHIALLDWSSRSTTLGANRDSTSLQLVLPLSCSQPWPEMSLRGPCLSTEKGLGWKGP